MNGLTKYLGKLKDTPMSFSFQVTRITLPVALIALAGYLSYLGVVYHDDWAKSGAQWAVIAALLVQFGPWLMSQGKQ
ncbi:MAG: hypothetical protein ABSF63_03120 [Candidatus Bathyarchaeia archaeon]